MASMQPISYYYRKISRIILGLQSWLRVSQGGLFDEHMYLRLNPGLPALPWYLTPTLHWVLYGRGIDSLNPTTSHLKNAELMAHANGTREISEFDYKILAALDAKNLRDIKINLHKGSNNCAILAAHTVACKYMDIEPAKSIALRLNRSNYQPTTARQARQWLDIARAAGVDTKIAYEALNRFMPHTRIEERVFLLRLPQDEDLKGLPTKSARVQSLQDTIKTEGSYLAMIFKAATANETGNIKYIVKQVGRKTIVTQNNENIFGVPTTKIRVPMPIYWAEPQRTDSVLGPVTRMMSQLFESLLEQGEDLYPVWATPIYDISHEKSYGYRTLSYHSICQSEQAVQGDVHVKESYLPGWFSLDSRGYSGWSSLANHCPSPQKHPKKDAGFVARLQREYLDNNQSKYTQSTTEAPPPGYIFAALQVPDDTVATLAHMPMAVWTQALLESTKGHRVVFKRHPKDTTPETDNLLSHLSKYPGYIESKASISELISGAKVVVTSNSGVGFESLIGQRAVITCGKSDYSSATIEVKTPEDLDLAINNALTGQHPISINAANAFIRFFLEMTSFTLDDNLVADIALHRTE